MAEDASTAPLKPQDTVIYLLGELKGQVGSLTNSVNSSAASQAAINTANEAEHAEFRKILGTHDTQLAVLNDGKKTQQENKLTRWQLIGLWIGAPSGLASFIGLIYLFVNK